MLEKVTILARTRAGDKLRWPAIVSGPTKIVEVETRNGPRKVQRAKMISMRSTAPDAEGNTTAFWRESEESLAFTITRDSVLPGIDVDEVTGFVLTKQDLLDRVADSIETQQDAFALAAEASVQLDAQGLPL